MKYRSLFREKEIGGIGAGAYTWLESDQYVRRKATADGNLFMVFGEPDLTIHRIAADSKGKRTSGKVTPPAPPYEGGETVLSIFE